MKFWIFIFLMNIFVIACTPVSVVLRHPDTGQYVRCEQERMLQGPILADMALQRCRKEYEALGYELVRRTAK